jgi:hypothetical protein
VNDKLSPEELAIWMSNIHWFEVFLLYVAVIMLLWFLGMMWAEAPKRKYWRERAAEWESEPEEDES